MSIGGNCYLASDYNKKKPVFTMCEFNRCSQLEDSVSTPSNRSYCQYIQFPYTPKGGAKSMNYTCVDMNKLNDVPYFNKSLTIKGKPAATPPQMYYPKQTKITIVPVAKVKGNMSPDDISNVQCAGWTRYDENDCRNDKSGCVWVSAKTAPKR